MVGGCHPNALLILADISSVISAGREEDSWSLGPEIKGKDGEKILEEPFYRLRADIFTWREWPVIQPIDYLSPFLRVIKAPETSGKLTAAALRAVKRILDNDVLEDAMVGVADAVHVIAESVTQCKFESSHPAFDECVLTNILEVLVSLVNCPQGKMLSHSNLIDIFQACYRIGHMKTEKGRHSSEMLTLASQKSMSNLVRMIFSRIKELRTFDNGASPSVLTPMSRLIVSESVEDVSSAEGETLENHEKDPINDSYSTGDVKSESSQENDSSNSKKSDGQELQPLATKISDMEHSHHDIVSLLPEIKTDEISVRLSSEGASMCLNSAQYGVPALAEVLGFVISMIGTKPPRFHSELPIYGIDLISEAIQAAGPVLMMHPQLMGLLRQDLIKSVFAAADCTSFGCLASIGQLSVTLYSFFRFHLMPQIEAILDLLLIPIAEGSKLASLPHRQAAMETLLDFCRQPGFLSSVYLNFDCRIQRENLFEKICGVLSKSGFPGSDGGISSFHSISLEGMRTILENLRVSYRENDSIPALKEDTVLDFSEYFDIWTPLSNGDSFTLPGVNRGNLSENLKAERKLKIELASVVDHFNKDQKKGFEYCQSLKLLPSPLTASSVAKFLKSCPGLSKSAIGEVLGERDSFYEDIRSEFIKMFDFRNLRFDIALRLFMDAFRPPGEGQKIDRIVQSFGKRYFEQVPQSGLKSADAAYVLAFSVIMLNTDLHNSQNKKKMTLEDFARINRNTNEGDPMPSELLSSIYSAISQEEFKISAECSSSDLVHQDVFWSQLSEASEKPRGRPVEENDEVAASGSQTKDMFILAWGPALAAISVILDSTSSPKIIEVATDTLCLAAELSHIFQVDGVIDQILASLVKYSVALDAEGAKPAIAFGASFKSRRSVETIFKIADQYGDSVRAGWKYVVSCLIKLYMASLLTAEIIMADGESIDDARSRMPVPVPRNKGYSGSIFTRAINSLISIEADEELEQARTENFIDAAKKSAEICGVERLINDSKFLVADSLVDLIKAICWSGSDGIKSAKLGDPSDIAELTLELLIALSLRNRDRIALVWPFIHEYLASCTSQEFATESSPLVERSVKGMMKICQRLLPYKEDTADMLLSSLSLIGEMSPGVVWDLSPAISLELTVLISQSAPYIRTENGWRTIAILIRMSASRPEALPNSLKALMLACRNPGCITPVSYMPLLETILQLIDDFKEKSPRTASEFLDCAESLFSWLPKQSSNHLDKSKLANASILDLWLTSVSILAKGLCREQSQALRDTSMASLHQTLLASNSLDLSPDIWTQAIKELVLPLVSDLATVASSKNSRKFPGIDKTLRMGVNMLTKVLLQYISVLIEDNDFTLLWKETLVVLKACMANQHEEITESVPENTKNMLLVLANQGILKPEWSDQEGVSLWELTWTQVKEISPNLDQSILESGVKCDNKDSKTKSELGTESSDQIEDSENNPNQSKVEANGQPIERDSMDQQQRNSDADAEVPACKQS